MKKSLIVLAALGAFASVASAQSSVTMYGRVDLSVGKESGNNTKYMANGSGSRLGMRGAEDLGGGMSAFFNIEHRFAADTGAVSDPNRFWTGRSTVGLQGGFGKFTLGREYTTAFLGSQLAADPWGWDTVVASSTNVVLTYGEVLGLTTPQIQALSTAQKAALGIGAATTATSNILTFGGTVGITGLGGIAKVRNDSSLTYNFAASGFSFGAQIAEATDAINNFDKKPVNFAVGYAAGPLVVGLGYEVTGRKVKAFSLDPGVNVGKSESALTLNGSYDLGAVKLGAFYGQGYSALTAVQHKAYLLSAVAPLGQGEFRAAFGELKADGEKVNRLFAVGYHYALSKRTTLYVDLANNSGNGRTDNNLAMPSKTGYDFGLKHNF